MTINVNSRQVGGTHYAATYQHWDFVTDTDMPYLLGCATKYVTRWRKKNGKEDLQKALHYLQKAKQRGVYVQTRPQTVGFTESFIDANVEGRGAAPEAAILRDIVLGQYDKAAQAIEELAATA